ncbi:MAG: transcriptional regulator, XRE family protein, partial [Dehalococcoidia bacterium]
MIAHLALDSNRRAAVATAMLRAADRLGLSLGDLSAVVDVSKPLERLKQNGPSLTGKPYELALLF